MRTSIVRAVVVGVVLPAGVGAQTLSLTESQALAQLTLESPRVQAARAGVDVARADVLAAGRWPNPRVTFNREAVAGIAEDMVMVSQSLSITGRRRLDVSAAAARVDASASRADEQVRRLRADLRLAFTGLWAAQVRERELGRSRDRLRDLADVLGRREAAGDAAGFDRLRAEREVIDVDADRATAAAERARAQAVLASYFAAPTDAAAIEAVRPDHAPRMLPPIEELVARAEHSRGDLIALGRDLDAAGLAERAAARRVIPEPEVVAGTKSSTVGGGDVGSVISVHVAVPLFDRARPERAAAQARARQVRAEAEVFRRTLLAQIVAWRAALVERRDIGERYRAAVAATADQIERIAQVSYDAGERGILELLDAHRTASSARVRQAVLDAAVREAEIELEFVSGWEIP
jgi:cobalt-zinc-cadmium efflux system outer membrane protein